MTHVINAETVMEYAHSAYTYLDTTLHTISDSIPVYYQTVWEHVPDFKTVVEHVPYHETIAQYVPDYETLAGYVPEYATVAQYVPILDPIMENVMEPIIEHVMEPLAGMVEPVLENMPERDTMEQMLWNNISFLHTCVKFYYLCIGVLFLGYAVLSTTL